MDEGSDSWSDDPRPIQYRPVSSTPAMGPGEGPVSPGGLTPVRGRPPPLMRSSRTAARSIRAARRRIAYSSEEDEEIPVESSKRNLKWRERRPRVLKYVDDNLQIDRLNMETAVRSSPATGPERVKHAVQCQNTLRAIVRRAEDRGMKVNAKKTAMICTSGAQSYKAKAFVVGADGQAVNSGERMKVLGFHLSSSPTIHAHIDAMCK